MVPDPVENTSNAYLSSPGRSREETVPEEQLQSFDDIRSTRHLPQRQSKTIGCATTSLSNQVTKQKDASFEAYKKLKVYSLHVIKNEMTFPYKIDKLSEAVFDYVRLKENGSTPSFIRPYVPVWSRI
ncbi:hypothetical protein BJV82DRAFT_581395 [Fennellomyces sp. T-0311]|nr:hypothetical protein BJV82DRAFT_581395 [Fennellomyces sp. T-0311]